MEGVQVSKCLGFKPVLLCTLHVIYDFAVIIKTYETLSH